MAEYCVCTRADDGIAQMAALTHPIMRGHVARWKADFVVLKGEWEVSRHYRILEMHELLQRYRAVLCLDTDMLIMPNCPNPFERFRDKAIATVFEDQGTRRSDRLRRMAAAAKQYGDVPWTKYYPNTGFFYVPRAFRRIFELRLPLWKKSGYDDVYLGYIMRRLKLPVVSASFKWNHMTMFSESWNYKASRFDSFIIHYAGQGRFDKGVSCRMEQVRLDVEKVYGRVEA